MNFSSNDKISQNEQTRAVILQKKDFAVDNEHPLGTLQ